MLQKKAVMLWWKSEVIQMAAPKLDAVLMGSAISSVDGEVELRKNIEMAAILQEEDTSADDDNKELKKLAPKFTRT